MAVRQDEPEGPEQGWEASNEAAACDEYPRPGSGCQQRGCTEMGFRGAYNTPCIRRWAHSTPKSEPPLTVK